MDLELLIAVGLLVAIASFAQLCIGFGVGAMVGPVLMVLDPSLMPVSVLLVGGSLSMLSAGLEWSYIDWVGLSIALVGRLPGVLLGVLVVVLTPVWFLKVLVGIAVLFASMMSLQGERIQKSWKTLLAAGAVAGFAGTATGVAGPPMALVYQSTQPETIRATLGAFFVLGTSFSLLGLYWADATTSEQYTTALALLPFAAIGALLGRAFRGTFSAAKLRFSAAVFSVGVGTWLLVDASLYLVGPSSR